jgi:succinyl-CoA synthetase beta subunit
MLRLTEDEAKTWLAARGLPVPRGAAAATPADAERVASRLGGAVFVKAIVPTGRRGLAGGVRAAASPAEAGAAAAALLGANVLGHAVERVYVEERIAVARELYLAFAFGERGPRVALSAAGGVDIEAVGATAPERVIQADIDPLKGLRPWEAVELWRRAGVAGSALPRLARLASQLARAFREADALILEINPLALHGDGEPSLVGALMGIDDNALFRHPAWRDAASRAREGRRPNEREQRVVEANRKFPGGSVRYTELDGDIGLLVGGGGAGLLQHDLILAAGGRPANHTDTSPGPIAEKVKAILGAIFDNPRVKGLLVGYNIQQMSRCDNKMEALAHVLREKGVDPRNFPIVVRLLGPEEARARAIAAEFPGIRYLPPEATLADAVSAIVALAGGRPEGAP